jgi:hypothetical protein
MVLLPKAKWKGEGRRSHRPAGSGQDVRGGLLEGQAEAPQEALMTIRTDMKALFALNGSRTSEHMLSRTPRIEHEEGTS